MVKARVKNISHINRARAGTLFPSKSEKVVNVSEAQLKEISACVSLRVELINDEEEQRVKSEVQGSRSAAKAEEQEEKDGEDKDKG